MKTDLCAPSVSSESLWLLRADRTLHTHPDPDGLRGHESPPPEIGLPGEQGDWGR